MRINSLNDLRQYVSSMSEGLDAKQYMYDYDDLVEAVTIGLNAILAGRNFKWGNELPEISDNEFWDLFKKYEKS